MDKEVGVVNIEGKLSNIITDTLNVDVSVYYPTVWQCDNTPNITADGSIIKDDPFSNKWCAISRDLLKQGFNYGDTIELTGTWIYDGKYIIHDIMNKRYKHSIDLLISEGMYLYNGNGQIIIKKCI